MIFQKLYVIDLVDNTIFSIEYTWAFVALFLCRDNKGDSPFPFQKHLVRKITTQFKCEAQKTSFLLVSMLPRVFFFSFFSLLRAVNWLNYN